MHARPHEEDEEEEILFKGGVGAGEPPSLLSDPSSPGGHVRPHSRCNDVAFAVLFLAAVSALVAVASVHAGRPVLQPEYDIRGGVSSGKPLSDGMARLLLLSFILVPVSGLMCFLCLHLLRAKPVTYIRTAVYAFNVMLWAAAIASFASGNIYGGIVTGIFALIHLGWAYSVQRLIPFTASLLLWVGEALERFWSVFGTALFAALCQVCAFAGIVAASSAVLRTMAKEDTGGQFAFVLYAVFVAFWTFGVLQNVVHVTTAGAIGTWYYQGNDCPKGVPGRALRRAVTTSFGSICLGSLMVAVVQTLRFVAQYARRHAKDNGGYLLALCCECFVGMLEAALRWFNSYAFVIVALRGEPYLRAASQAYELVSSQGISMLINDDLTGMTVAMSALVGAAVTGGIAALVSLGLPKDPVNPWMTSPTAAFLAAFLVTLVLMNVLFNVVVSSTKTLFVCVAENPAALSERHQELAEGIRDARSRAYEEERDASAARDDRI